MSEREPITAELRAALDVDREFMRADGTVVAQTFCVDRDDFDRCCDAIDAIHAGLERENAELRERVAVLDNERENMHDGGSITDELRKVAVKTECANGRCEKLYRGDLEHIADRIDAEHESACAEAYGNGVMSVPIALDENQWVKLPLDADGVPIRVGDVMEWPTTHETFEVVGIGDGTLFYIEDGSEQADWTGASTKRHHHAPTVEDVLREMADRCYADEDEPRDRDAIVAEYAPKLRLAGDAS